MDKMLSQWGVPRNKIFSCLPVLHGLHFWVAMLPKGDVWQMWDQPS